MESQAMTTSRCQMPWLDSSIGRLAALQSHISFKQEKSLILSGANTSSSHCFRITEGKVGAILSQTKSGWPDSQPQFFETVVSPAGLEPATHWLKASCSTN